MQRHRYETELSVSELRSAAPHDSRELLAVSQYLKEREPFFLNERPAWCLAAPHSSAFSQQGLHPWHLCAFGNAPQPKFVLIGHLRPVR